MNIMNDKMNDLLMKNLEKAQDRYINAETFILDLNPIIKLIYWRKIKKIIKFARENQIYF